MVAMTIPSDIERAACTILANDATRIVRPELRTWVDQITADQDYAEYLDGQTRDAVLEHKRFEGHGLVDGLRQSDMMLDEAIYRLAGGVVEHRRSDRQSGDITSPIGYGFTVTTSLAANVAEYVARIHQMHGVAMQEAEDRLSA